MPPLLSTSGIAPSATLTMTTTPLTNVFSKVAAALHSRNAQIDTTTRAIPSPQVPYIAPVVMDDNWLFRTGYTAVSLFCMMVLALMLGMSSPHCDRRPQSLREDTKCCKKLSHSLCAVNQLVICADLFQALAQNTWALAILSL
jgi:hypothetical protein